MNKPTKEQLLEFVNNNNIDYDPVIDDESALRHFKRQRDQYKSERDTLIEDVEKLREELRMHIQCNDELGRVNKLKDETISELSYYRTYYIYLTNYIKEKAEHNPGNSRYIDLVDVIEVLEAE